MFFGPLHAKTFPLTRAIVETASAASFSDQLRRVDFYTFIFGQ